MSHAGAWRGLAWLGRYAPAFLAVGVFTGLALQPLAALLWPLLIPTVALLLVVSLLRTDWRAMAGYGRKPMVVIVAMVWLMVAAPVLLRLGVGALGAPDGLTTAVTLMTLAPPIISAAAFALILGLDAAMAMIVVTAATVVTPVTVPPLALWLLGLDIEIGVGEFSLRLGLLVGGAFLLAFLARRLAPPGWITRHAAGLDGIAVILLLIFAIGIMNGVTAVLVERPWHVALYALAAFAANVALQIAGAIAFLPVGPRRALTMGFITGNRNMGIVVAAIIDRATPDLLIFLAMIQFPMYILPAVLRPLYRRWLVRA